MGLEWALPINFVTVHGVQKQMIQTIPNSMPRFLKVLGLIVVSIQIANADSSKPSHDCRKPQKPYSFLGEFEMDMYFNDVKKYKECLSEFIDEQNDSIENHRNAAQEAIDDWETFKRRELR